MDSHHLSIFASAFLGAISASAVSLVIQLGAADPRVGASPTASIKTSALPAGPVRNYPAGPHAGSQDDPVDDCDMDDFCDGFDDNDPIEV